MDSAQLNWLTNFIWNIADDVLRDVYVRGKYRDAILPMTVLRRLDAVLEPTKAAVLKMKAALDQDINLSPHAVGDLPALDNHMARREREIALMHEYRTRLTAEVVTGKLDVRPAAARLPEVDAEPSAEYAVEEFGEEETAEE